MRERIVGLWVASLVVAACQGGGGEPRIGPIHQISYEAIPTPRYEVGPLDLTLENASYEQRQRFTVEVRDSILPDVVAVVGLTGQMLTTELTPGGYQLVTNPSLQSRVMADMGEVESFAAAIGYVFYQWSVLVTDFSDTEGGTGYAVVSLDVDVIDPELGQGFFLHAANREAGLGSGYFAYEDELIFLNIRGADGEPYSGLEDQAFVAALKDAARTFAPYRASVAQSGEAGVLFVENDWGSAPAGEDYLAVLDPLGADALAALAELQEEHLGRFDAAVAEYGWQ